MSEHRLHRWLRSVRPRSLRIDGHPCAAERLADVRGACARWTAGFK